MARRSAPPANNFPSPGARKGLLSFHGNEKPLRFLSSFISENGKDFQKRRALPENGGRKDSTPHAFAQDL
jgi:hypothetical protein